MKKIMIILLAVLCLSTAAFAQDGSSDSDTIGLTIGLDYNSNYLWRGTYFFNKDGAVLPSLTYDVMNSGLVVSFVGEFAASYFFEGSKRDRNGTAFANNGADFGIDYSYTLAETITVGAGVWYFYYWNNGSASETGENNYSFLSANLSIAVDALPLTPTFNVYYDHYIVRKRGGDYYFTLGLGHDFELTDEVTFGLGYTVGYYYNKTNESNADYVAGTDATPIRKGVSDMTFTASLGYSKGMLGFSSSFNYVIVPSETYYNGSDLHRFYATFGVSLSF